MRSVSLIVPSWHYWANPLKHQPYWELYQATNLRERMSEKDTAIDLIDLRGHSKKGFEQMIAGIPQRDYYFYWIMKTGDAMEVYSIARKLKEKYPKSVHAAGGTHVDMCTEECATHFDACVVGPGESSYAEIIKDAEAGRLKKVYEQSYSAVPFTDTPFPRRDFLPRERAVNTEIFAADGRQPATLVYFSRGCIYKCSFCVYNVPNTLQMRSPKMMRAELDYLKKEYGVKGVLLKDEVAIHPDPKISDMVFDALDYGQLVWRGQTTTRATLRQLERAKASGCLELAVGVETVDDNVMKIASKQWQTQKQIREFIENAKKVGIKIKMCFIFGLPGEPRDIVERTIKFLEETRPDYVSLSGFCPVPGSPMFKNPEFYGIKRIDHDWSKHAHLMFRFSDEEEVGLPFEYEKETRWGKSFTRQEIAENIRTTQRWLEAHHMTY